MNKVEISERRSIAKSCCEIQGFCRSTTFNQDYRGTKEELFLQDIHAFDTEFI